MLCHWNHPWRPSIAETCLCVWDKRDQLKVCWCCSKEEGSRKKDFSAKGCGRGWEVEGTRKRQRIPHLWEVIGSNHGDSHLRAQGRDAESVGDPSGSGLRNWSKDTPCQIPRSWKHTRNVWKGKWVWERSWNLGQGSWAGGMLIC